MVTNCIINDMMGVIDRKAAHLTIDEVSMGLYHRVMGNASLTNGRDYSNFGLILGIASR